MIEIINSKPEFRKPRCFEHLDILILDLFWISGFGFGHLKILSSLLKMAVD